MSYSQARAIPTAHGIVRIFQHSGETGWKSVLCEIPPQQLMQTRSGSAGATYASTSFLDKFCDEAGLIERPDDDDLQLIAADIIWPSDDPFDPSEHDLQRLIWTDEPGVPSQPAVAIDTPQELDTRQFLRAIDLDFTVPLRLPDGNLPPAYAYRWDFAVKKKQLALREHQLLASVREVFATPGGYHKLIGPVYANNVTECILRLWGVLRNQLRVPRPETITMNLFDPTNLAYYFRFVACSSKPGRGYTKTVLATEVYLLEHAISAMMTLASRGQHGLQLHRMPHGIDAEDVRSWIACEMRRAVAWKAHNGPRKKERDVVCRLVTEAEFDQWVGDVQGKVDVLMQREAEGEMQQTAEAAEYIQDLAVCLLLGAGIPPQRRDVLATLMLTSATSSRTGGRSRCSVPGLQHI